jgi:hypothetical protein
MVVQWNEGILLDFGIVPGVRRVRREANQGRLRQGGALAEPPRLSLDQGGAVLQGENHQRTHILAPEEEFHYGLSDED